MAVIIILVMNYDLHSNVSMMDNFLRQNSCDVSDSDQLLAPPRDGLRKIHHNRSSYIYFFDWTNCKIQPIKVLQFLEYI